MLKSILNTIQGDYTWIKNRKRPTGMKKLTANPKRKRSKKEKHEEEDSRYYTALPHHLTTTDFIL